MSATVHTLKASRAHLDALPERNADDWRSTLAPSKAGGFIGDERNILRAFRAAPELVGLLRYNEFALRSEFTRSPPWRTVTTGTEWTDADDTAALAWFQEREVQVRQRQIVGSVAELVAHDNTVHPVREYLNGLTWDGTARLTTWLIEYLGAVGTAAYLEAVGRKFLISAVARICSPGCQVDHTLVIESGQGWKKSTALRVMAVRPEWFTDELPDVHSKDAGMQVRAHWIVELGELAALRRSDIEPMKAFLTRRYDDFRPPYQRRNVQTPRQCVFTGSTNDQQYLRDPTGNRRFWPVRLSTPLSDADLAALEGARDQLWAEALAAYRAGEPWHLTHDENALAVIEQGERMMVTQLESKPPTTSRVWRSGPRSRRVKS